MISCGNKSGTRPITTIQAQDFEVLAEFTLDGRAELELLNKHYDPQSNCIQLVKRKGERGIEFSRGFCSLNPSPVITLKTDGSGIFFNGTAIGTWDLRAGTHRLFELCSGPYTCHFTVTASALTNIDL